MASPEKRKELLQMLSRYRQGIATEAEKNFVETYLRNIETEADISDALSGHDIDALGNKIWAAIKNETDQHSAPAVLHFPAKSHKGISFTRMAVAASILLVVSTGVYFLFVNNQKPQPSIASTQPLVNDALPGEYKAKLILDDGTELILDSAAIGELVKQGTTTVVKKDGQVIYKQNAGNNDFKLLYNTIATANGQTYSLTLSDGSKVWLNAHSSIRFPVVFDHNERKVEVTGEAYFEVAKDATKQFIVAANGTTTEVLGTHFNVNAYDDESDIKVTLLEGSVKVSNDVDAKTIKPGQQVAVVPHAPLTTQHSPDVEQVIAWKNGLFNFERSDLKTVMRQLARWYDVDIQYTGSIPNEHFSGKISRNMNASKVLKVLEYSGVQFKIEGKTIIVYP